MNFSGSRGKNYRMQQTQRMLDLIVAYREIDNVVLKQALERLSWTHHIKLISKVKEPAGSMFYLQKPVSRVGTGRKWSGRSIQDFMNEQVECVPILKENCRGTNVDGYPAIFQ